MKKIISALSALSLVLGGLVGLLSQSALADAAPASVNVTIVKYVDGQPATAQNTDSATFSMHVNYTGGEGDYLLGPVGVNTSSPYQIIETMPAGANSFNTYENMYGAVGPSCASNLPYVLSGYTTGDTLADAAAAAPSMTAPSFSNLSSNEYVIVWNASCGTSGSGSGGSGNATLHFVKVICPSYSDIAGNADADNLDATGGNYAQFSNYNASSTPHFPSPYVAKPVSTSEIPASCAPAAGWQFKLSSDQGQMQDITTTAPTGSNGEVDVSTSSLTANQQSALTNGGLWVSEVPQSGGAAFGALRCYQDANNGDDLESINFSGSTPTDAYCIAYNVLSPPPQSVNVDAYKVICQSVKDMPDWGTANNPSRPTQMTPAVIASFVANSKGQCWYANNWQFQYGGPNVKARAGNFIGPAGGNWNNFNSATGGTSATPATLTLSSTSTMPSMLWVREDLQKGYVPFTDADGTSANPNTKSAELFCNTDGLNYDNYDQISGPLNTGTTYYCLAINALKDQGKNGGNDNDGDDGGNYHISFWSMNDYKGIKNNWNFGLMH